MTITILFRNGKELSIKCESIEAERSTITGRVVDLHFKGIEENKIIDLDFNEIIAIYRKVSDEVLEDGNVIDEAENYLIALKHCETCEATDTNICKACPYYRRGSSAKCYDAIDVAIEIMDKYQKIEKVYRMFNDDIDFPLAMHNIGEVLGNDN